MFVDIAEGLALSHLARGDTLSALIAGEWYARPSHFAGWARPLEFNAELYARVGRDEEARDTVRCSLCF